MIKRPEDNDAASKKPEISAPEVAADAPTASELWRERLHKNKIAAQNTNPINTHKGVAGRNVTNRFQNTPPGDTARKTRKGLRAG